MKTRESVKTVVTKGRFAEMKGRTPAAVSNWIKRGRITATALVGEGNNARIWVEQAERDLALALDPAQQAAHPVPQAVITSDGAQAPAPGDDDLARRRKADADRAEQDAEAARRRNAVESGRWIEQEAAAKQWGAELAKIVTDTETFLTTTLARDIAERTGQDWKTLSAMIRDLYRKHRTTVATDARGRREAIEAAQLAEAAE